MTTKTPKNKKKKESFLDKALNEVVESELTNRQKRFCVLITTDKECFGHKARSYAEAYELHTSAQRKNARFLGSRLYSNDNIQAYVKKLLRARFKDTTADDELAKLMVQDSDLPTKRAAIADYNKLKNRVKETPQTGPITIHISPDIAAKMKL